MSKVPKSPCLSMWLRNTRIAAPATGERAEGVVQQPVDPHFHSANPVVPFPGGPVRVGISRAKRAERAKRWRPCSRHDPAPGCVEAAKTASRPRQRGLKGYSLSIIGVRR
jgi:hypothetical protein